MSLHKPSSNANEGADNQEIHRSHSHRSVWKGPCLFPFDGREFWNRSGEFDSDLCFDGACKHVVPWVPVVSAASWNARSAFPANPIRACYKSRGLDKLLRDNDMVMLQEAHLATRFIACCRNLASKHKCVVFGYAHGQASGGNLKFAKVSFLENNCKNVVWEDIVPGRVGCLKCWGDQGAACFYNIHMFPCTDQTRRNLLENSSSLRGHRISTCLQVKYPRSC